MPEADRPAWFEELGGLLQQAEAAWVDSLVERLTAEEAAGIRR